MEFFLKYLQISTIKKKLKNVNNWQKKDNLGRNEINVSPMYQIK